MARSPLLRKIIATMRSCSKNIVLVSEACRTAIDRANAQLAVRVSRSELPIFGGPGGEVSEAFKANAFDQIIDHIESEGQPITDEQMVRIKDVVYNYYRDLSIRPSNLIAESLYRKARSYDAIVDYLVICGVFTKEGK